MTVCAESNLVLKFGIFFKKKSPIKYSVNQSFGNEVKNCLIKKEVSNPQTCIESDVVKEKECA